MDRVYLFDEFLFLENSFKDLKAKLIQIMHKTRYEAGVLKPIDEVIISMGNILELTVLDAGYALRTIEISRQVVNSIWDLSRSGADKTQVISVNNVDLTLKFSDQSEYIDILVGLIVEKIEYVNSYINNMNSGVDIIINDDPLAYNEANGGGTELASTSAKLKSSIPADLLAPLMYQMGSSRLERARKPANAGENSRIAASSRKALIELGGRLLDKMRKESNRHPSLIEEVQILQDKIEHEEDVIQLGIMNGRLESYFSSFKDELSPTEIALFATLTKELERYVSQFPDWQRYVENYDILKLEFTKNDLRILNQTAARLKKELTENTIAVDREVPESIEFVQSLINDPGLVSRRTAYAAVRSLENLFSTVYSYAVDFLDGTIKLTIEHGKKAAAYTLILTILGAAIRSGPVISKLSEAKWLEAATKAVRAELDKFQLDKP